MVIIPTGMVVVVDDVEEVGIYEVVVVLVVVVLKQGYLHPVVPVSFHPPASCHVL